MGRMLGSWLSGPSAATDTPAEPRPRPGVRLGLPESGAGSVASVASRVGAFCVDAVLSGLVAGVFTAPDLPRNWSLVALVADYVVFTAIFSQTPGMRLFGIRLVRLPRSARTGGQPDRADQQDSTDGVIARTASTGVPRAVIRMVLLALLVPALIWDADGRGLHDRAAATAVVRA